jgi:hypothetical protein
MNSSDITERNQMNQWVDQEKEDSKNKYKKSKRQNQE